MKKRLKGSWMQRCAIVAAPLLLCFSPGKLLAETGANAWLRYAAPPDPPRYHEMPHAVVLLGDAPEERSAAEELDRGLGHMISGTDVLLRSFRPDVDAIVLGTTDALHRARMTKQMRGFREQPLPVEGFRIVHVRNGLRQWWVIQGGSPRAELYGAFRFMALVAQDRQLPEELVDAPSAPVRWVSQWDRADGSVEHGYAGPSIFFQDGLLRGDLRRVGEYGRLLASVGINGLVLGPPSGEIKALSPGQVADAARIAEELRPWGVRLALSVDGLLPSRPGTASGAVPGTDAAATASWWQAKTDEIYRAIPDFAGFSVSLLQAPGRPGTAGPENASPGKASPGNASPGDADPSTASQVGSTYAGQRALSAQSVQALASPLAQALGHHGGVLLLRVPGIPMTETFKQLSTLDGRLPSNLILQIAEGPSSEGMVTPVSPLPAALRHTPQVMEVEVTQEFTGQQREMVYLPPMWRALLQTDLRIDGQRSPLREVVSGRRFLQPVGGFVGVANVGMETNWLHHPMALANLYSFGRMAWNPALPPETVLEEWTRMTWSNDARVMEPIERMQMASWDAWQQNTLPLGLAMRTAEGSSHFGPVPQALAMDATMLGTDRTAASGDLEERGFAALYPAELAARYASTATCPEEYLLFFHRVPYTATLPQTAPLRDTATLRGDDPEAKGKTVLQHIFDAHYAGAATEQAFVDEWESIEELVDDERYAQVHTALLYQAQHAEVWRDAINDELARVSGVPDALGYVGRHPGRVEAEAMAGMGFHTVDASASGAASGGKVAVCTRAPCTLHLVFQGEANPYRIEVGYFDRHPGEASYRLLVNGADVAHWKADDDLPPGHGSGVSRVPGDGAQAEFNGDTATRFVMEGVRLKPGDVLTLEATPDRQDLPAVDFLEVTRDPRWN